MNLDVDGLRTIYADAEQIFPNFTGACGILEGVNAPEVSTAHRDNALNEIYNTYDDLNLILDGIFGYILTLEEANKNVEKEANSLNFVNFWGDIWDRAATTNANRAASDMYLASGILSFVDKEASEGMAEGAQLTLEAAQKADEANEGAKWLATAYMVGPVAGREALLRTIENMYDGARSMGSKTLQAQYLEYAYSLPALLNPKIRDTSLGLAAAVAAAEPDLKKDIAHDYTRDYMNEYVAQEGIAAINDAAEIKYLSEGYMLAEGIHREIDRELVGVIPGVGVFGEFTAVYGNTEENELKRMKMSTKEGIREAYSNGTISEEEMKQYEDRWNLTKGDLLKIEQAHAMGAMDDDVYNEIMGTYAMPEKWNPTEKELAAASGLAFITAGIETAQTSVGKHLDNIDTLSGHIIRPGTNLAFSVAEEGTLTYGNAAIFGVSPEEEFKNSGGLVNIGVGVFADTVIEGFNYRASRAGRGLDLPENNSRIVGDTSKTPDTGLSTHKTPDVEYNTPRTQDIDFTTPKLQNIETSTPKASRMDNVLSMKDKRQSDLETGRVSMDGENASIDTPFRRPDTDAEVSRVGDLDEDAATIKDNSTSGTSKTNGTDWSSNRPNTPRTDDVPSIKDKRQSDLETGRVSMDGEKTSIDTPFTSHDADAEVSRVGDLDEDAATIKNNSSSEISNTSGTDVETPDLESAKLQDAALKIDDCLNGPVCDDIPADMKSAIKDKMLKDIQNGELDLNNVYLSGAIYDYQLKLESANSLKLESANSLKLESANPQIIDIMRDYTHLGSQAEEELARRISENIPDNLDENGRRAYIRKGIAKYNQERFLETGEINVSTGVRKVALDHTGVCELEGEDIFHAMYAGKTMLLPNGKNQLGINQNMFKNASPEYISEAVQEVVSTGRIDEKSAAALIELTGNGQRKLF